MNNKAAYDPKDVAYISDKYAVYLSQMRLAEEYIGRNEMSKTIARKLIGNAEFFANLIPKNCRQRLVGNALNDLIVKLKSR